MPDLQTAPITERELREAELQMTGRPPAGAAGFIGFVPAAPPAPSTPADAGATDAPADASQSAV